MSEGFVLRLAGASVGVFAGYVALHMLKTDPLFGFALFLMAIGLFGVVASDG